MRAWRRFGDARICRDPPLTKWGRHESIGDPALGVQWDESVIPLTVAQVRDALKNGGPRIPSSGRRITTRCMRDGEEILVAERVRQFFLDDARRLS